MREAVRASQAHPGGVRCLKAEPAETFAHLSVSVEGRFITAGRESGRTRGEMEWKKEEGGAVVHIIDFLRSNFTFNLIEC